MDEDMWYRATISELASNGNELKLFCVDYGQTMGGDLLRMRKLEPEFMKIPGIAIRCCSGSKGRQEVFADENKIRRVKCLSVTAEGLCTVQFLDTSSSSSQSSIVSTIRSSDNMCELGFLFLPPLYLYTPPPLK